MEGGMDNISLWQKKQDLPAPAILVNNLKNQQGFHQANI